MNEGTSYPDNQPSEVMRRDSQMGGRATGLAEVTAPPATTNQIRQIVIKQLNHGYIIDVGCQSFAIEKKHTLIANLEKYLTDPQGIETKWMKGNLDI